MPPRSLVLIVVALLLVCACCGDSEETGGVPGGEARAPLERSGHSADAAQAGARAVNGLGLDLLRLNGGLDAGNVALSPWSIATSLAMTRVGARGKTATEMDRVLHVADPGAYDQAMNSLDQAVRARNQSLPVGDDEPLVVDLSAANRLFAQTGLHLLDEFVDTLSAFYRTEVGEVDYKNATEAARRTINEWIADETRQRIRELIAEGVLDSATRLVLANAVYLRADWSIPFDNNATIDRTFHAPNRDVTVPFMQGTEQWRWSEGDGWTAIELPYVGGDLAMTLVVPDDGQFNDFVSRFDETMLERVVTTTPARVKLRLPKFDLDHSVMLAEQLRTLGMPLAFGDAADLSGVTTDEPLQIAEVIHQANITVDEKGTVAAAATATVARTTSAIAGDPKELDVDRPFLFLLRDRPTGALLFAGQVTNPA